MIANCNDNYNYKAEVFSGNMVCSVWQITCKGMCKKIYGGFIYHKH